MGQLLLTYLGQRVKVYNLKDKPHTALIPVIGFNSAKYAQNWVFGNRIGKFWVEIGQKWSRWFAWHHQGGAHKSQTISPHTILQLPIYICSGLHCRNRKRSKWPHIVCLLWGVSSSTLTSAKDHLLTHLYHCQSMSASYFPRLYKFADFLRKTYLNEH